MRRTKYEFVKSVKRNFSPKIICYMQRKESDIRYQLLIIWAGYLSGNFRIRHLINFVTLCVVVQGGRGGEARQPVLILQGEPAGHAAAAAGGVLHHLLHPQRRGGGDGSQQPLNYQSRHITGNSSRHVE